MSSAAEALMYLAQCILRRAFCVHLDTVGLSKMTLHFAFYQIQRTGIQNVARASERAQPP